MYIDPTLGGLLLEPLFHLQASPSYQVPYAAADLGAYLNRRVEALVIEDVKGRITPMSQSAIHLMAKELSVCISLAGLAYHRSIPYCLYRVSKYVDHDLCLRSCKWRW